MAKKIPETLFWKDDILLLLNQLELPYKVVYKECKNYKDVIKAIKDMIARDAGGIIIVPARNGENDLSHIYSLRELNIPFVFITSKYHGIMSDCVMSNLEEGMYKATIHLLKRDKRKIYFITDNRQLKLSGDRVNGYIRAYKDCHIKYNDEHIIETNPTVGNGIIITNEILKKSKPDAIITANALLSLGVMKCIKDKGLNVPNDISVICFDELSYSSLLYTPITTVEQPLREICKEAVSILLKRIEGEKKPYQTIYLPTKLIVRSSS